MPAPPIPGFYYDEERKRYFKITNGSLTTRASSRYHNNYIQSKRRQERLNTGDATSAKKKSHKASNTHRGDLAAATSEKCRFWAIKARRLELRFQSDGGILNLLCGNASMNSFYNVGDSIDALALRADRISQPNTMVAPQNKAYVRDSKAIFSDSYFSNIHKEDDHLISNWSSNVSLYHIVKDQLSGDTNTLMVSSISMSSLNKSFSIARILFNGEDATSHLLKYVRDQEKYLRGRQRYTLRLLFGMDHIRFKNDDFKPRTPGDIHSKIARVNKHLGMLNSGPLSLDQLHESNGIFYSFLSEQSASGGDAESYLFEYNAHAVYQRSYIVSIAISNTDIYYLSSGSELLRIGFKTDKGKIVFDSMALVTLPHNGVRDHSQIRTTENTVYITMERLLLVVDHTELKRSSTSIRSEMISLLESPWNFHVVSANALLIASLSSIYMLRVNEGAGYESSLGDKRFHDMLPLQKLALLCTRNGGRQCMTVIGHNAIVYGGNGIFQVVNLRRTPLLENNTMLMKCESHLSDDFDVVDIIPIGAATNSFGVLYRNKTKAHYLEYNL